MSEHEAGGGNGHRTVRLDLAYRGTGFRGFAANAGVRTVAGELSAALERILGEAPVLTVAGRTDAGVHATGQVVSFRIGGEGLRRLARSRSESAAPAHTAGGGTARESRHGGLQPVADGSNGDSQPEGRPGWADRLDRLAVSLNRLLLPEITVTAALLADDDFDARHSAVGRAYEYRVRNAAHLDPRYADLEWHVTAPLDVGEMNAAAGRCVGEHDFTSFCRRPKGRPDASLVRTVTRAHWHTAAEPSGAAQPGQYTDQRVHGRGGPPDRAWPEPEGRQLLFEIEANAFCHQMVRAIVGHCVAVGRGDRSADDVPGVLAARRRDAAAPIAPPHGLTLVRVRYPELPRHDQKTASGTVV